MIIIALISLVVLGLVLRSTLQRKGIPQFLPAQIDALRKDQGGSPVLLDVRTAQEHATGAIPGSVHIPLQELRGRADELKRHGDREIVCYCQTGSRSMSAAIILKKMGFRIGNLKGGIAEWNFLHRDEPRKKGKK